MRWIDRQKGFGLIEVLIAIVVTSIVMLSLLQLQCSALQMTQESFRRSQAIEVIRGLTYLTILKPSNLSALQNNIQNESNTIFPQQTLKVQQQKQSVIQLSWFSGKQSVWHCAIGKKQYYSCLEVKVSS